MASRIYSLAQLARGGRAANVLDLRPEWYAFVSHIEGGDGEAWTVDLQTVRAAWMDRVWAYLTETGVGSEYAGLLDGSEFADVFPSLTAEQRNGFFLVFLWFVKAVLDEESELFGRAPTGLFRFTLEPDDPLREGLQECMWMQADLAQGGDRYAGTFILTGETFKLDKTSRLSLVPETFVSVPLASVKGRIMRAGLHALHFPQVGPPPADGVAPDADGGPRTTKGLEGEGAMPMEIESGPPPVSPVARMAESLRGLGPRCAAWFQELFAGTAALLGGLQPAYAGAPLFDPVSRYIGSPDTAAGNAGNNPWNGAAGANNQAQNPMIQTGNTTPFVGVLDVGQGSCNFLCDDNDQVFTYFDFGYPTGLHGGAGPAIEPNPCLCHRPLIIISHWDSDHWGLSRRVAASYNLQWIAPQQHMGTYDIAECLARILVSGGHLYLWTGDGGGGGTHMTFPWGYVERETGPNPLLANRRNTTGLVAYVCVRDQKAADAVQTVAAPVDNSVVPNVAQCGGGMAAAGRTQMVVAAPPANWPAALNWAPFQTEAAHNVNARTAARAAVVAAGAVGANLARVREVAALTAACAYIDDANNNAGVPTAQQCADLALGVIDACIALAAVPTPRNVANIDAWLLAQPVMPVNYPGFRNAAAAVGRLYGENAGVHSDLGAADPPLTRLRRMCAALAVTLAGNAGGEATVLGNLGVSVDANATQHVMRVAIRDGLVAVVRNALHPGPAALHDGLIPHVQAGAAPFSANEHFILITGDADFGLMPSQLVNPPPVVVGLVAAHHGAKQMDNRQLTAQQIPWAPLSVEADAARAAGNSMAAANNLNTVIVDGGEALWGGVLNAGALAAVTASGKMAEELLNAMAFGARNPLAGTQDQQRGIAGAAVAALAAYATSTAAPHTPAVTAVAVATAGAAGFMYCDEVHPSSIGIASAFAAAASDGYIAANAAPGAFAVNALAGDAGANAVLAQAAYWAVSPALRAIASSLGNIAVHVSQRGAPFTPYFHVAGLPQGQAAAIAVGNAPAALVAFLVDMVGRVAGAGALNAIVAPAAPAISAPPPAGAPTWRQWAAIFGGEHSIAATYSLDPAKLRPIVDAGRTNTAPAQPPGEAGQGIIAYSYGVDPNGYHCHPAQPGGYGHPHPFGVGKYAARGWTERRNTPNTTASIRQPDASPWGPIALGWFDNTILAAAPLVAYEGPLLGALIGGQNAHAWTCATCPAPQIASLVV